MPEIVSLSEYSRGVDWVKLIAEFDGILYDDVVTAYATWLDRSSEPYSFGCEPPVVMRVVFDDSKAIFKFWTEPYSMESNDFYRWVYAFGKTLAGPGLSGSGSRSADDGRTIDMVKPKGETRYRMADAPGQVNAVRVKSLISRIVAKNAV